MITLQEALKLSKDDLITLKEELTNKIEQNRDLGAYIEQLTNKKIYTRGSGIPIAIKDNINIKNFPMTCASSILQGYIAPYDATIITKLEENGFSPFGITNMDEFAMGSSTQNSFYGSTLNPVDGSRIPGGSSGGSAAAVAASIAIAAIGTDTGGSIRQPAAYCGCVGMKPSYGRVSRYGIAAYSSSLDQAGVITQNVTDAALLYDAISGYDPKDSMSMQIEYNAIAPNIKSDRKLTIAVLKNFVDEASEDVKKAMQKSIDTLKEAGHTIVYENMFDTQMIVSAYYIISGAEASANLARFDGIRYGNQQGSEGGLKEIYNKTRTLGFGAEVKKRLMLGSFVLSSGYYDAYYIKAQKVRELIKQNYNKIFANADVILSPVTPTVAPKIGSYKSSLEMYLGDIYTISINLAGLPAISLPVSKDSDGMPIGLQFIGKEFDEQTIFDAAKSLEETINYKG
ncbi:MAG: Asp-tRNA(Asn)/Glu-tRNA(Gln) amidotransferase subunit GatA [Arcobacter butzleri]|nr:Asp-tRNA(Asn)/Glu-tRNA(Gln) amidotransferase subunit GatA [Arcobacteraceae bacterium]MDY0364309.1 Asp-tRNA(Asn)/Glu-tRNA(Gln) amidotransferase subunit GatA [Arcobacteraceae bacterium]NLO16775.1 Asp-tRNA(Asn)/Glu-tRNA(Gln) amidotransferase subunit GatA [Aliarcobacter butzleri]